MTKKQERPRIKIVHVGFGWDRLISKALKSGWKIEKSPFKTQALYPPEGSPFWDKVMSWIGVMWKGKQLYVPKGLKEMLKSVKGNGKS